MNYYYDMLLNFQDKYYKFYEWDEEDELLLIKKIPMIHIESKDLNKIIRNVIKVNEDFLKSIFNKTKLRQNKLLEYACIFSDGKNSIAVEFNNTGESFRKSSLLLDDEININEFSYSINKSSIKYDVLQKEEMLLETRQEQKIRESLLSEINKMYKENNASKLKYIYLAWFDELNDDLEFIYTKMLNKLEEALTKREYKIYELLKISYNNV